MSGHDVDVLRHEAERAGANALPQKPFMTHELDEALRVAVVRAASAMN